DSASSALDFEGAAAIHARLEKLKPVLSQLPEAVHRIDRLSALMVQPSHIADCVTFFRIDAGYLSGPVTFSIQTSEHTKSQSMESRVLEAIRSFPEAFPQAKRRPALEIMEHLALFRRWYYRGSRLG